MSSRRKPGPIAPNAPAASWIPAFAGMTIVVEALGVRNLPVNAARLAEDIDALAAITEPDRPYTRRAFTPMFLRAREWLDARFRAAGLETHIDAAGNLIAETNRRGCGGARRRAARSETRSTGGRSPGWRSEPRSGRRAASRVR